MSRNGLRRRVAERRPHVPLGAPAVARRDAGGAQVPRRPRRQGRQPGRHGRPTRCRGGDGRPRRRRPFRPATPRRPRGQGVGTAHVGIDAAVPTGVAGIVVDDDGRNCILVAAGANGCLDARPRAGGGGGHPRGPRPLCQLEVPVESTLEAFRLARAAGVRTVLTPAPVRELPEELLRLTDVCVLNEAEAPLAHGGVGRGARRRGPAEVIVTLGERGCLLSGAGGEGAFAAPAVRAVDTTGAGDAFVGALAAGLAGGIPLRHAIPRAAAAAALSVTRAWRPGVLPVAGGGGGVPLDAGRFSLRATPHRPLADSFGLGER